MTVDGNRSQDSPTAPLLTPSSDPETVAACPSLSNATASDAALNNNEGLETQDETNNIPEKMTSIEAFLRTAAKLAMIFLGLSVVVIIFFWPAVIVPILMKGRHFQSPPDSGLKIAVISLTFQTFHVILLIYVDMYLYIHRFMALPIRIPLMPLLNVIIESEAIREKDATIWYNDCRLFPKIVIDNDLADVNSDSNDGNLLLVKLLTVFKSSVRRDIKHKLRCYHHRRISTTTRHCNHLSLRIDIPVIWDHQIKILRRQRRAHETIDVSGTTEGQDDVHGAIVDEVTNDSNNDNVPLEELLVEFLSRFLVIFLVSNAYIDRYYFCDDTVDESESDTNADVDGNNIDDSFDDKSDRSRPLVALAMFVVCDRVLMNNMYFSIDEPIVASAGIWQYNHIRGLLRAVIAHNSTKNEDDDRRIGQESTMRMTKRIDFVNFFHHQDYAKRLAGALPVNPNSNNKAILKEIFPFRLYREPPRNIIDVPMLLDSLLPAKKKMTKKKMKIG